MSYARSHTAVGYTCLKYRTNYTDEQNPQLIVTEGQELTTVPRHITVFDSAGQYRSFVPVIAVIQQLPRYSLGNVSVATSQQRSL